MSQPDSEARYLELASREGMESLRQECPVIWNNPTIKDVERIVRSPWVASSHSRNCECQGRGWLPKPEAERLGALVRVATMQQMAVKFWRVGDVCWAELFPVWKLTGRRGRQRGLATTPEAALTEALLAATEVKA